MSLFGRPLWPRLRRNPGAMIGLATLLILGLIAAFGPSLSPYDPIGISLEESLKPPSLSHPFGTDSLGRDMLSRVMSGARLSFEIVVVVLLIAALIGIPVGLVSGFYGGFIDDGLMRLADIILAFPSFLLALAVAAVLEPSLNTAMAAVGFAFWPRYARLVRGQVLVVNEMPYVEAAVALGASNRRLLWRHILPNAIMPAFIQLTTDAGAAIIATAGLGFFGLASPPPTPEWGAMVADGRTFIGSEWWIPTFPGLAISVTVAGYMLVGDGLRDILDPRLAGSFQTTRN